MNTCPMDIPRPIAIRAVEWQLALQAGETSEASMQQWLAEDDLHRRAWAHIQSVNQRLNTLTDPAARAAVLSTPANEERRRIVKTLTLLFFTAGAGTLTYREALWRVALADIRTTTGERRHITLPDGSRLDLNSGTAVNIQQTNDNLRIQLLEGEILLTTTGSLKKTATLSIALTVVTNEGEVHPLGTRFAVQQHDGLSQVDVQEGSVAVYPHQVNGRAGTLEAGQRSRFTQHQLDEPQPTNEFSVAWVDGMLVATSMPLGEFLHTLSRHRHGHLGFDPAIAHLPVSGTYPLNNTDMILVSLAKTLPVKVQSLTRYWVHLLPEA